jgi:hypothetical protein
VKIETDCHGEPVEVIDIWDFLMLATNNNPTRLDLAGYVISQLLAEVRAGGYRPLEKS